MLVIRIIFVTCVGVIELSIQKFVAGTHVRKSLFQVLICTIFVTSVYMFTRTRNSFLTVMNGYDFRDVCKF